MKALGAAGKRTSSCRSTYGRLCATSCCVFLSLAALLLPSCATSDGNFSILGYTTRPNYDTNIHSVRVPIFQNVTFRRGLEFDLTRAVIREIESKTHFK